MPKESKLIYDWNLLNDSSEEMGPVEFNDETLRDGIQSPSARDPNIENKLQILHLMDSLGIKIKKFVTVVVTLRITQEKWLVI